MTSAVRSRRPPCRNLASSIATIQIHKSAFGNCQMTTLPFLFCRNLATSLWAFFIIYLFKAWNRCFVQLYFIKPTAKRPHKGKAWFVHSLVYRRNFIGGFQNNQIYNFVELIWVLVVTIKPSDCNYLAGYLKFFGQVFCGLMR